MLVFRFKKSKSMLFCQDSLRQIGTDVQMIEDQPVDLQCFLVKKLVSWSSRKQAMVSHSCTKAEYKAIANVTAELI
jgi:TorA maturation chaperone TorD